MYVYLSITLVCVGGGGWDGQLAIAWVDGEAMVLVEVGLGDPDGKWEGLVDDDKGWPKPGR